jgi:hypothetical protein
MDKTVIAKEDANALSEREVKERESVIEKAVKRFDLEYQEWTKMNKRIRNSFIQFPIETFYKASGRLLNQDIRKAMMKLSWIKEEHYDLTVETRYSKGILTVRIDL